MKLYSVIILSIISCLLCICYPNAMQGQNISGVVNTYHKVTAINIATNTLTLTSAAGITPGVKVIVIQMKGVAADNSNSASFGNITSIGNAGNYEFNYVCSVIGNDVMLVNELLRTYTVSGMVQLVTVPVYPSVVVTDTLFAAPWNPATGTGGIVAIEATNSITLNKPINATGKGFKGGDYIDHPEPQYNCDFSTEITAYGFANPASGYQTGGSKGEGIVIGTSSVQCGRGKLANAGGGANNHNAGGAGGSNYAAGGGGGMRSNEGIFNCHGTNPGIGGLALASQGYSLANNRVFLGGGGGAGHGNNNVGMSGGDGGGIVFIKANILYGNDQVIVANGARPYRAALAALIGDPYTAGGDGGGGGGGGGVIVADISTYGSDVNYEAKGGDGSYSSYTPSPGCFGPGGGGGGGMLWVKTPGLSPSIGTNFSGGANGLVSVTSSLAACRGLANGATPGSNGNFLVNYVPPASTNLVCVPLPLNDLLVFTGKETAAGIELTWKMRSITGIRAYVVERSVDKVNFTMAADVKSNGRYNHSVMDGEAPNAFVYYRLKVLYDDGHVIYSPVIVIEAKNKSSFQLLRLAPNPARNTIGMVIRSEVQGPCEIGIYTNTGQKLVSRKHVLSVGINQVNMDVQQLAAGVYFLVLARDGKKLAQSFVKVDDR